MRLICGDKSTSHVAHVRVYHVAHVTITHVAHVTITHVAHVRVSFLSGLAPELPPLLYRNYRDACIVLLKALNSKLKTFNSQFQTFS